MGMKKLFIIVSIVIIVFVLVFIKKEVLRKQTSQVDNLAVSEIEVVNNIPQVLISKIIVYKGENQNNRIVIAKDSKGVWLVEDKFNAIARQDAIANILNELLGLKGEVRAESKNVFRDFQIEDAFSAQIILEDKSGKALSHILVSFLQPEWSKNFIRQAGSEKIVLVNKNILALFNLFGKEAKLDDSSLVDYRLCQFEAEQIDKIGLKVKGSKEPLNLKKAKNDAAAVPAWGFEPLSMVKGEIDQAKVKEFLNSVANLYAMEVLDPAQGNYGFNSSYLQVILESSNSLKPIQIDVGDFIEPQRAYYIKSSLADQVFKIPEAYVQHLKKDKTFFLKPQEKPQAKVNLPVGKPRK